MAKKYTIKDFLEIKSSFAPAFSPDNSKVAYQNNDSGTSQLYIFDRKTKTKKQITKYESGIDTVSFSPTENKIIFTKSEGGSENSSIFLYDLEKDEISNLTPEDDFRRDFNCWSEDGKYISYSSNEENGVDFFVNVMNLKTKKTKIVFEHNSWNRALAFSPSGKYLVINKMHSNFNSDHYLLDLEKNTEAIFTEHKGNAEFLSCKWLPDSSGFYFLTNQDREFFSLFFFDLKSKKRKLLLEMEQEIERFALSKDGSKLAIFVNQRGYSKIKLYATENFSRIDTSALPDGFIKSFKFSKDGKEACFTFDSAKQNPEVHIWNLEKIFVEKITTSDCAINQNVFVEPTLSEYYSFDGLKIPYFKFIPKNTNNASTIVMIHGGPESQYRPSFSSLIQYFIYKGYAVIAPNIRGSSGYGRKYMAADNVEKRFDCLKDMEYLCKEIKKIENIDSNKVALFGGSYGGYMVLLCLTLQPNLWAAGVDIVGIFNFVTYMKNTSAYRRKYRESEYGSLKNHRKLLEKLSPINYVGNIKAPLFCYPWEK